MTNYENNRYKMYLVCFKLQVAVKHSPNKKRHSADDFK